jgi:transcriptional regulator with XRE-family HTH domain
MVIISVCRYRVNRYTDKLMNYFWLFLRGLLMDMERFGKRLRELRAEKGLTQKALAEQAGVSQATVSSLEQGVFEPVWSSVVTLAQALGVDCRAFLEEPAEGPDAGRGRPKKPGGEEPAIKRPRGRPRKGEAEGEAEVAPASFETSGKKAGKRKGK